MSTKVIEGYEDYFVSDQGNVYSNKSGVMKKLKPIKSGGYLIVNLSKDGVKSRIYVHRLIAQAFIPNSNDKPCVNHKDGNKQNNNADNLEWVTYHENNQYFHEIQKPNGIYDSSEETNNYRRRWHEEHKEEIKVYEKQYRAEHKEEINACAKRYRAEHPEKMKEYRERYKAKRAALKND